jgi:hypothetical protein
VHISRTKRTIPTIKRGVRQMDILFLIYGFIFIAFILPFIIVGVIAIWERIFDRFL